MPESKSSPPPVVALVIKTNEGALWIVSQIMGLLSRGYRVAVILPEGKGRLRHALDGLASIQGQLLIFPIGWDFTFAPNMSTFKGLVSLRGVLRSSRAKVVFYHLYASALAARLASVFLRVKRLHMVAGPLYLENRIIKLIERFLGRMDDHIICGSEFTRDRYREISMPESRLSYVPYGVDLTHFGRGLAGETRDSEAAEDGIFTVVMVAYFYAPKDLVHSGIGIKGHETLLRAWRDFYRDHNDVRLILVGSGFGSDGDEYRQRLKQQALDDGINESLIWVDTVEDVRSLYALADVSVSPSISDNHGAVLEASAMELPSIVSDAGALQEAVTETTGWIFETRNHIQLTERLVDARREFREGKLSQRGAAARQFMATNFDIQDSVEKISSTVDQLLDR